jgi:hypothetical protein
MMRRKTIMTQRTLFVLVLLFFISSASAERAIHFNAVVGLNASHPVVPPNTANTTGKTYSVDYIPGYDGAGLMRFEMNRLAIGIGLGYKSINFNQHRTFVFEPLDPYFPSPSYSFTKLSFVRLKYMYMPLTVSYALDPEKKLCISLTTEFCKLVNELVGNYNVELYEFYKPNVVFLYLGAGMRLNEKAQLALEFGYAPRGIDRLPLDYPTERFSNISKKVMIVRVQLIYKLFNIAF